MQRPHRARGHVICATITLCTQNIALFKYRGPCTCPLSWPAVSYQGQLIRGLAHTGHKKYFSTDTEGQETVSAPWWEQNSLELDPSLRLLFLHATSSNRGEWETIFCSFLFFSVLAWSLLPIEETDCVPTRYEFCMGKRHLAVCHFMTPSHTVKSGHIKVIKKYSR